MRLNIRRVSQVFALGLLLGAVAVRAADSRAEAGDDAADEASTSGRTQPVDWEAPIYIPPDLGLPGERVGGGTRGSPVLPSIDLLAPDHPGFTTRAQPTLYWYLDGETDVRVDFTIQGPGSAEPLLDTRVSVPAVAGVNALKLAGHGVQLEPDVDYQWFVSLVPDPERRSSDVVRGAWIRRVAPSPALAERLELVGQERAVFVYAENGLWYDAIGSLSQQIRQARHARRARWQRAALLDQIGLRDVAERERGAGAKP